MKIALAIAIAIEPKKAIAIVVSIQTIDHLCKTPPPQNISRVLWGHIYLVTISYTPNHLGGYTNRRVFHIGTEALVSEKK